MAGLRSPQLPAALWGLVLLAGRAAPAGDAAAWPLAPGTVVRPASVEQGRRILTARDAYIRAILPRERKLLMGTEETPSEAEFLAFLGEQVLPWSAEETRQLQRGVTFMGERIADVGLQLRLPETILPVKTTGRDLSRCAYTRAHAIVLPQSWMEKGEEALEYVLIHELFHVWSRHNPEQRDQLYRVLGFERCRPIPTPKELLPRQFTNPDAPTTEHVVAIDLDGARVHVALIPVFEDENPPLGVEWGLSTSLIVEPLVVERHGERWEPQRVGGELRLLDISRLPGLYERIGMNTPYVVQPEEILAENFVLALNPGRGLILTPRIPEAIRMALGAARVFTCAMHPQVRIAKPGKCPICLMDLVPAPNEE